MSQPSLVPFPKQPSEPVEPRPFSHNLPIQPTPLIGREREFRAACDLLRRPEVRLLTLTGPPGIGKTRLAIAVGFNLAEDFANGIYFVALAPITEPELVLPAIAQSLGVKEDQGQSLSESLANHLSDRQALLVLDNFEQVVEAATEVAGLLARCPRLKMLVTSRELLQVYGEHDYPVPPLSLPDLKRLPDPQALSRYQAIELFVQRAQAVSPGFELTDRNAHAVAEICLRLDGLPLAIELAAARILVLPPEVLLSRLDSRLKLLTRGPRDLPERQRTLEDAIDWSYNLLDPAEQALFRRLGIFVDGCTLQAVAQICAGEPTIDALDGVTSLVSKSLLLRQEDRSVGDEPRFMMLETIREYAREKLGESGELTSIGERHLDYFLQLAEDAEREMLTREEASWMRRLEAEQSNLRAALEWTLSTAHRARDGLRLAVALARYWDNRGHFSEGRQWYEQLLRKTEPAGHSIERAKALGALGRMVWQQGDFAEARSILENSLEMSRALADDPGVAVTLFGLGSVLVWQGEYDLSRSAYEECLAISRRLGARRTIAGALSMVGVVLMRNEDYRAAQPLLEEVVAIRRELGNDGDIADALFKQGTIAFHLGEYERAKALVEESLSIAREQGVEGVIAACLARLGMIYLRESNPQLAESCLAEGLARAQRSGIKRWSRWYLVGLAEVARLGGMRTRAATLIGASEGAVSAAGARYEPATHREIERIISGVKAGLDEHTFARLRAEGQSMTLEEAIAYATGSNTDVNPEPEQQAASSGAPPHYKASTDSRESGQPYPDELTEREIEVLRLIAAGKSNQEIAQELVLSLRTVERHISNIYLKIGATGRAYARATATAYALKHGLTT